MKPLFIPLKTEHFNAFARGAKQTEFRLYGARWNERTCTPGRKVVLSKGYGKQCRLNGAVASFAQMEFGQLDQVHQMKLRELYDDVPESIVAAIGIELEQPPAKSQAPGK